MHDRIAELRGLRAELDNAENGPRRESRKAAVDAITEQIARVRGELAETAGRLEAQAANLTEQGQDVLAAERTVEARHLRAVLEEEDDGTTSSAKAGRPGRGGKRTAVAAAPPDRTEGES